MAQVNKSLLKKALFMVVILISLMSGALLHAYAGVSTEQPVESTANDPLTPRLASSQTDHAHHSSSTQKTVDVCPGDTLWEIAAVYLPRGENIHSYMNKIKKANGLKNSNLKSGQILIMP